jgi:hypothetical protein
MLYLPLAASYLFACLFMSPYLLRRTKELRDEEQQAVSDTIQGNDIRLQAFERTREVQINETVASTTIHPTVRTDPSWSIAICSLAFMALAAGLSSRFEASTTKTTILVLQVLFSAALGLGASRMIPAGMYRLGIMRNLRDAVLNTKGPDLEHANLVIFAEMIGGAMGIAAAQAVFISQLSGQIPRTGSDLSIIWSGGATNIRANLSGEALNRALAIFNTAITRTFYLATAAGALPVALPLVFGAIVLALMITPLGWALAAWYLVRKRKAKHQHIMVQPQSYPMQSYYQSGVPKKDDSAYDPQTAVSSTLQGTVVSDHSHYSSTLGGTVVSDRSYYSSTLPSAEIRGRSNFTQEEAREHIPGQPPALRKIP